MTRQDTRTAAQRHFVDGRANTSFRLIVLEGPDKGLGLAVPSKASRSLLGTSSACDLRLTDPSVSRRHATLDVQGSRIEYVDLDSHNGTFANEVAIGSALLWGGERLQLGDTTLRVEVDEGVLDTPLATTTSFGRLLGRSVAMRRLFPFLEQLAQRDLHVIVEGEPGTGKELLAETLHTLGARAAGPVASFDARLPNHEESLQEAFHAASGGTLILDEVGELSAEAQLGLLRLLDRNTTPAGKWNVRVIATTTVDLDKRVQDGAFREDLFYRLVMARVELPPLRRRRGDVAMLAAHFWEQLGGAGEIGPAVVAQLERLTLSGNVRELENRVAQLVVGGLVPPPTVEIVAPHAASRVEPSFIEDILARDLALPSAREHVIAEFERLYVDRILAQHGGNVTRAAAASGLARRYFQHIRARRSPRT